jgi:hypothetical protein|nr:MAG TPA: hypothetical protein [Caudoviricetes sp.]
MRQIGTIIEELEKTNNEVENYELIYNLLSENRIDDAKDNLSTLLKITTRKKDSNMVIYKLLKMVNDIYFSDRKFNDVVKYHNSYIDLLNISKGGVDWIYGDNQDLIVESNVVIINLIKNIIPDEYDKLILPSSVYDYTIMSIIHKDIDEALIRWISEIMRCIEILDTYLIQHELFSRNRLVSELLEGELVYLV